MPAPRQIEVAPRERVAVEAVLGHQLHGDPQDAVGPQAAVLVEHERGLQVVVERHDPGAVAAKVVRRRLPFEVNENALDRVGVLDGPCRLHRLGHHVLVDPAALQNAQQNVLAQTPGHEVRVQRVDVGVRLGVVTEQGLGGLRRRVALRSEPRARPQERRQLVAELIAHRAEAKAQEVLQVGLERERVPGDAVQAQLVLEAPAHLLG
jgi:hypothetical protein